MARFSQDRPTQRRRRRSSSRYAHSHARLSMPARIVILLSVVLAIGTGVYLGWLFITSGERAKSEIRMSIASIADSDKTIVPLNELVGGTIGSASSEQSTQVIENVDLAFKQIDEAKAHLRRARDLEKYLDTRDRDVLSALDESISARTEMVAAGRILAEVDASVASAQRSLNEMIEAMVQAKEKASLASQAAQEYARYLAQDTTATIADGSVAVQYETEALALLDKAKTLLKTAKESFADAIYTPYEEHLEAQIEAITLMKQADEAIVNEDFEAAATLLESYNKADEKSTKLAEDLPESTAELFVELYSERTKGARETYAAAADRARTSDASIRDYQGTVVQVTTHTQATTTSTTSS